MGGEADPFPSAERFAAQNQKCRARSEVGRLLEHGVEDVDLRLAALDGLNGALEAIDSAAARGRCGSECGALFFERLLQAADGFLNERKERDGVDVSLNALKRGLELLVDRVANVFDRRANLADHFFANVRVDRARDFVSPHGHNSSRYWNLPPFRARRLYSRAQ